MHFTPPPLPAVYVSWKLVWDPATTEFGLAASEAAACVASADPTETPMRAVAIDTITAPFENLLTFISPPLSDDPVGHPILPYAGRPPGHLKRSFPYLSLPFPT